MRGRAGAELRPRKYLCLSREWNGANSLSLSYHTQKRVLQIINHARKSARADVHTSLLYETGDKERERGDLSKSQKDSKRRQVHLKGRLAVSYQEGALFPGHLPSTSCPVLDPPSGSKEARNRDAAESATRIVTALILLIKK